MKKIMALALCVLTCSSAFSFVACEETVEEPKHEHSYTATVVDPTCTEKGYTTYTCECGDTKTGDEVAAKGHTYKEEVIAPTCLADGYTKHTCDCGDTYNDTPVAKNPTNHRYTSSVVSATCTKQGYTQYTCECGDTYQDTYTPIIGHSFADGVCACGLSQAMLAALTFNEYDTYCEVNTCDREYVGEMIIPATYNGKPVNYIRAEAFNQCRSITSVTIPEGVIAIGANAFNLCEALSNVQLPDTLVQLGDHAFANCISLQNIQVPSSVKIMKTSVFSGCTNLQSTATYGNCYYLGNTENPYMILYKRVADNCEEYPIHENATIIYDYAFAGTTNDAFVQNNKIRLHDGITSIGNEAFKVGAHFFVERVPSSLLHVGEGAFDNGSDSTSMGTQQASGGWFMGNEDNPYLILVSASVPMNGTYTVNANTKFIYDNAFSKEYDLETVEFHDDVLEIGSKAFYDCYNLKNIRLPNKLTELREQTFYMPDNRDFYPGYIVIPNTVKEMDWRVFSDWWGDIFTRMRVYYQGTEYEWSKIYVDTNYNEHFSTATKYFYSETQPVENPNKYWHYVDGVPTVWS